MNAQECGFQRPEIYDTYENKTAPLSSSITPNYCINVVFRILRDNDGSDVAFNPSDIPQVLAVLNQNFNQHGISFIQVGTYDYINNTGFNHYSSTSTAPPKIPNALNIYFIKDFGSNTNVGGIGNDTHVFILGSLGTSAQKICHEVGHCLNLLHTFTCSFEPVNISCAENPNGTNSNSTGDYVSDTPADPYLSGQTIYPNSGPYTYPPPPYPSSSYHPDLTNFMSYYWQNSPDHFTLGQGQRMRDAILNAPYLQSVRSNQCAAINGSNYICSTGINTFTITAYGSPLQINWTVTSNLQIVGSTSGSSVSIKSTDPFYNGMATITVTMNGTIVKTKTITVGPPINEPFAEVVGLYDWVSNIGGNMGLIAPTKPSITSFRWTISEDEDFTPNCPSSNSTKPRFINSTNPYEYISTTNQAVVNWGTCTGSYLITCYARNECGENVYNFRYVDVGSPKNNPCYKNSTHVIIAPNPILDHKINIMVNKTPQQTPCNWKQEFYPKEFNRELDKIRNLVTVYDYNGTMVYSQVYDTDEFIIDKAELSPGNYIVNTLTNEGVFSQEVIIIE